MLHRLFRKKLFFLGLLGSVSFFASFAVASNPTALLSPTSNIVDPGSPSTAWGGCGPYDSNCYIAPITNFVGTINTETTLPSSNAENKNTSDQTLLSALRDLFAGPLPSDILSKLQGPKGDTGEAGNSIDTSSFVTESFFDRQVSKILSSITRNNTSAWGSISGTLSSQTDLQTALDAKQSTLVSGTSIKTINSTSLLGSGDIVITSAGGDVVGPASAVDSNFAAFDTTTGKLIKDSGYNSSSFLTSLSGALLATGATTGATSQSQIFTNGATLSNITLGSVLFAGTAGVISQDNSNLFYDATNYRLGIGTMNPTAHLQVNSSAAANIGLIVKGYSGQTANLQEWHNSAGSPMAYIEKDGDFTTFGNLLSYRIKAPNSESSINLVYAHTDDYTGGITFTTGPWNGQVERLRITDTGNIGIGTLVPSNLLSVTPTQYSTGTASQATTTVTGVGTTFTSAMVGSQLVFANGVSAGTITAFIDATHLTVSTSQTVTSRAYNIAYTGLQVGSTGNVGIGTTTPATALHVAGTSATSIGRFDIGIDLNPVVRPDDPAAALIATETGNVDNGVHYYYVTYYTDIGETQLSSSIAISATVDATHKQVSVTIPVSTDYRVVGRKVYRTPAGANYYTNVKTGANFTIANNTETTFIDNFPDTDLTSTASYYRDNTTNKNITVNGTAIMAASSKNTIFGYNAGATIFAGTSFAGGNVFLGLNVGNKVTTAAANVGVGPSAFNALTSGSNNIAIGNSALMSLTTGSGNVGIGWDADAYNATGVDNTNIGYGAGFGATGNNHSGNTNVGSNAGYGNTTGSNNTNIGYYTGSLNTSGGYNVNLGYGAGYNNLTGTNNVNLGFGAGYYETGSNKFFVDNQYVARTNEATARTSSMLYGVFNATVASQTLTMNGMFGVNIIPTNILHVTGTPAAGTPTAKIANTLGGTTQNNGLLILAGNDTGVNAPEMITFQRPDTTVIGSISQNAATTVAFNTSSDRRVKENIVPTTFGLSDLLKINVSNFTFINDPNKQIMTGFIAQDLNKIYPEAVTTNGDNGIDPLSLGKTPWMIDYSKLTPLLVKSVQDLNLNLESITGATVPLPGSLSESFVSTFFKNVFTKITTWLADTGNGIVKIFTGEIDTKSLCVSDNTGAKTCITKAQLDALISGAGGFNGGGGASIPTCTSPQVLDTTTNTCIIPPDEPTASAEPTEPATPIEPTEPMTPDEPTVPDEPTEPAVPTEPQPEPEADQPPTENPEPEPTVPESTPESAPTPEPIPEPAL